MEKNVVGPAGAGGGTSAPVPWWQLPGQPIAANNLDASAPPGYQYDRVQMRYVPILGSPTDALEQRLRQQGIQDRLLASLTGGGAFGASTGDAGYGDDGGGGGGGGARVSMGSVGGLPAFSAPTSATTAAQIPTVSAPDTSAAQAAIFARAKDKVGLETAGSLTALRSALAGRGLLGGGMETKGTARILTGGQRELGDTTREGAIQEAQRLSDFAKLGYQGAIEQRGQDITTNEGAANRALAAATTGYQGQIATRGQDVGQNEAAFSGEVAQRGQDVAARGQDLAASTARRGQDVSAATAKLAATNALLSRLY